MKAPAAVTIGDLLASSERAASLKALSTTWPSWTLTARQLCDLELLLAGAFWPLTGFMTRSEYESVCADERLPDGTLWPMPIVLDIPEALGETLGAGDSLALRSPEGALLAALHVSDVWRPDRLLEAEAVYGTTSPAHPGVAYLLNGAKGFAVGGRLEGLELPVHYDFPRLRQTPAELRAEFARLGWHQIVALHTRGPMHRVHRALAARAVEETGARLLIHQAIGESGAREIDHYTRVRCCRAVADTYAPAEAKLSLINLAPRMAGPREALWHALVRRNYGCTHFIVGPHHGSPDVERSASFYEPYAAQEHLRRQAADLGIEIVAVPAMVYAETSGTYVPQDLVPTGSSIMAISDHQLHEDLARGRGLPSWFTFPEVTRELERARPSRAQQGFTILFTGLSGAGKSTIANLLRVKFLEMGGRAVTLLDGDIVRQHLSSELGFSREHRDINIRRIGYVASEITKNGGIAICAPIAPYRQTRLEVREMIEAVGGFVLVHVATPIEVCEGRDRKGLYAKARAGLLPHFTGISDPYETPADAEVVIDPATPSAEDAASVIFDHLRREGFI